jgi:hypothetical protein
MRFLCLFVQMPAWLLLAMMISAMDVDFSTNPMLELDVSWDFTDRQGASGWGNSTSEVMNMEVKAEHGELRCSIIGHQPKLDSPSLFLNITSRHYVIIRAKYEGAAHDANLLLRSGGGPSPNQQLLLTRSYWEQRLPVIPFSSSIATSPLHDSSKLVDGLPQTYYLSSNPKGVNIVFDLGSYRMITGLRVLPIGDENSPRRCLLQYSITNGIGPFQTVRSFTVAMNQDTLGSTIRSGYNEQQFVGFSAYSRYWRLIVLDNYNGASVGIREISLDGYDERVTPVAFKLINNGDYQNYYLPINTFLGGMLLRMRLEVIYKDNIEANPHKGGTVFREGLHIDYIRIIRAPVIWKVRGCLDKYYDSPNYENPQYNVQANIDMINGNLPLYSFSENNLTLQYATTYDCPLSGGIPITIEGINFGAYPNIFIGNKSCIVTSNQIWTVESRVQQVTCILPPGQSGLQRVRIVNGAHPGLLYEISSSLSYRTAPPVPIRPTITNICANKVDLIWEPPGDVFEQMTVTGYKIMWFQPKYRVMVSNLTVGNITTTSVRGLQPATEYVFRIAAMSEGVENANLPTDLYGRRDPTANALIGEFSIATNSTGTLQFDFDFSFFNSNSTLNHSSSTLGNSFGPTGQYGAEGQYGLVMVGSANVQNCNVSSTCCDTYNATVGPSSCGTSRSVCAVLSARQLAFDFVIDGITRSGVNTNLPYSNNAPASISILTLDELKANKGAALPSSICGPSLRLTPAIARHSGAAWYRRKMNVREGFDTYIKFQISNPSQKCNSLDDVNTYCRSRGADGLAFVIQNAAPDALGNAGSGLGYEGIFNSLAVELDTFFNYENMDLYENHISVMTQVTYHYTHYYYHCLYISIYIGLPTYISILIDNELHVSVIYRTTYTSYICLSLYLLYLYQS